jgi:methionyl-tRNA formyltransferase
VIDPATVRTVFMGTPAFAVPTLDVLLQAGLNLVGV